MSSVQPTDHPSALNILVLGNDHSAVAFYAYGIFKIAELSTPKPGRVKELCLSDNLEALSAIVELCTENEACLVTYLQWDTSLLSTCLQEITKMARTFTHISALLQYHQLTIQSMSGAIDDVLLEMDTGLTKYVEANKDICVSHELLELLLCGTARDSMVMLLANKLTVKGLKKLCQAMQSSYTSILKLLTGHLQSAAEALLYRLSELQGMARWRQQYQSLGLDEEAIEDATQAVGSYILKSNELLHVIENSLKNFRAFSYWLYNVILVLSDELIPPENSKMSQKDVMLVANFIEEHFGPKKNDYEKSGKYFSVERVSQYLKDEDLDMPQDLSQNSWCSFVKNSQPLSESPLLCRSHHKSSLCQMRSLMDAKVRACLHKPAVTVGKSLCTHVQWTLFKHSRGKDNPYCLSMWSNEHAALQMTLFSLGPSPADVIYLMETNTAFTKLDSHGPSAIRSLRPVLPTDKSRVIVLDAQFYDQDTVTMLLRGHFDGEEEQARALTQVSLVPTDGETSPTVSNGTPTASEPSSSFNQQTCIMSTVKVPLHDISIDDWRTLKNMDACSVAVNGQRSVACVMSNSRQHVRLYEMDAEEEELGELDETADGTDSTMDMIPAQLDFNIPHPEIESDSKL
uniref:anaphase-promoting complex subunit 4 isoform X2 n=1 Tax=Myxine glutinosa TaxID=7769 RepID=UPI00358DFD08